AGTNKPMSKISVLLVDDHAILRAGVRALLQTYSDVEVVGEAGDGEDAISQVRQLRPDVVVMDVGMPGMNGLVATRYILEEYPDTKVLILTQYDNKEYVLPLMEVGASGYVLKKATDTDLIKAIRAVAQEDAFLYPPVAKIVMEAYISNKETADSYETLTPREREVLVLVAQGCSNRAIGDVLHISPKTVDVHRTRLMKKLDLHHVADVTRYAIRRGLLDPAQG
ncbi:MAG: response regulator, partial [Anaerolineae bacterium]